jgi:beta-lactamase superfamily II metal-dependent hydrolase
MKKIMSFAIAGLLLGSAQAALAKDVQIINVRVGQGDATLIIGPPDSAGKRVTVLFDAGDVAEDGGRFDGGRVLGAVLAKHNVKALDYVIVSHYDVDHIGGLVGGGIHGSGVLFGWNQTPGATGDDDGDGNDGWVGTRFFEPDRDEIGKGDDIPVRNFVDRGDTPASSTQAYQKYKLLAQSMGTRVSLDTQAKVDSFSIDLGNGATMTALAGNGFVRGRNAPIPKVTTENERSLSFLLSYKKFDYLISGDMIGRKYGSEDAEVESAVGDVIASNGIMVDVLHVDHHGADNGSDTAFLEKIKPTIAVISSGNGNDHHHPNKNALRRLEAAKVYRIVQTAWGTTEELTPPGVRQVQAIYQSDVIITSDGDTYTLSTSRTFDVDKNPRRP